MPFRPVSHSTADPAAIKADQEREDLLEELASANELTPDTPVTEWDEGRRAWHVMLHQVTQRRLGTILEDIPETLGGLVELEHRVLDPFVFKNLRDSRREQVETDPDTLPRRTAVFNVLVNLMDELIGEEFANTIKGEMERELAQLLDDYSNAPLDRVVSLQTKLLEPEDVRKWITDLTEWARHGPAEERAEERTRWLDHALRLQIALEALDGVASEEPTNRVVKRVTVNLSGKSIAAKNRIVELTGDSQTETINKALQVYAMIQERQARGGGVWLQDDAGSKPVRGMLI